MKRLCIALSAAAILSVAGLSAVNLSSTALADSPAVSTPAKEQTQVFAVDNMTCPACPFTVKKAIARVAGVNSVSVDFDAKTATAVFDPNAATAEDIARAATDVGYPATPIDG